MSPKVPFVKQEIAWVSIIPQLLFLSFLSYLFFLLGNDKPLLFGGFTYLLFSYGLKNAIPLSHRSGIALIKRGKYQEAIPYFQKSVDFFTKYAWIDQYRYLTLLLSSKRTMREVSLCNTAFCMLHSKRVAEAKAVYEEVLKEYPNNTVANAALNTINAVSQSLV